MDIASISTLVATGAVIAGVVFAYLEVRSLVRTRQTELIIGLYSTYGSKEFQEALMKTMTLEFKNFEDFRKKYASSSDYSETPEFIANEMVSVFFEGIGVLLHRELINIELVGDLFSDQPRAHGKNEILSRRIQKNDVPDSL